MSPRYLLVRRTKYYAKSVSGTASASECDKLTAHHAIAPLLKTHQRLPQMPKLVRATTGNVTWKMAPGRAFATMNGATRP